MGDLVAEVEALLGPGDLYQPIEHESFAGRAVVQPCEERLELIVQAMPRPGTLLDVGCHTGWFCRAFARRGWAAVGIDRSKEWLAVAKKLNALLSGPEVEPPRYLLAEAAGGFEVRGCSLALCLSVVMYLFQRDRASAWRFLDRLSEVAGAMVMDFGGMYGEHVPFSEAEAIEAVTARTRWSDGRLLGRSAFEARPLFLFTR